MVCHSPVTRRNATAHVKRCIVPNLTGTRDRSFILKIIDMYTRKYWMYVKIKDSARLEDLDAFLRSIWLECCGHLSAFEIGGVSYERPYEDDIMHERQADIGIRTDKVLAGGLKFTYMYDFGSSTELSINVMGGVF